MTETAASPVRIRDRYKQMTREGILDAFTLLLERGDVASVSLAEVARIAGVSETTIYNHFKNKEELLDGYASRLSLSLAASISLWPAKVSPITALRTYMRSQLPPVADDLPTWQPIFAAARADPSLWGAFLRTQQRAADELAKEFFARRPRWGWITSRAAANAVMGVFVAVMEETPEGATLGQFHSLLDGELAHLERAYRG